MTEIKCRYGRDGYSVVSIGHAGTAKSCTAISAIVQSLAGWVFNQTGGGISLSKGEAIIMFPDSHGARDVMDLTVIGLLQVEKAAPDDVKVTVTREQTL